MDRVNLHATAVVVDGVGLAILGPSGSGKSALAAGLIDRARSGGRHASLVCDDRVWVRAVHGRVIAEAPEAIAGLIELRGFGPAPCAFEPRAVIDRVVALVDPAAAPRHREAAFDRIAGIALPRLDLAARDTRASAAAILAWIDAPAG